MKTSLAGAAGLAVLAGALSATAAPSISRLTPPSALFSFGDPNPPVIARFLPGQKFDLQATVRPESGKTITAVVFKIDNVTVPGTVATTPGTVGGLPANTIVASLRAISSASVGTHTLTAIATQSDASTTTATGNFEVVGIQTIGKKAKNVIIMIGSNLNQR